MVERQALPSDMSRCDGDATEWKCQACKRRAQLEHDDQKRWFPRMTPQVVKGQCLYWIAEAA